MSRGFLYVINLAFDLRLFGLPQAIDSQGRRKSSATMISRVRAHLPPVPGRPRIGTARRSEPARRPAGDASLLPGHELADRVE